MKGIVFREFIDMVESCFEQSMSRTNGCLELSHVGLGSGDWYVRHQSGVNKHKDEALIGLAKD